TSRGAKARQGRGRPARVLIKQVGQQPTICLRPPPNHREGALSLLRSAPPGSARRVAQKGGTYGRWSEYQFLQSACRPAPLRHGTPRLALQASCLDAARARRPDASVLMHPPGRRPMEQKIATPDTGLTRGYGQYLALAHSAVAPILSRSTRPFRHLRKWRKGRFARPLAFLTIFGPGLIAANAGNDAGAVATWSSVGAQFGYQLLWVLVIITVSLSVVQEMCARMGAATGKGLSDLIRERFGVRGAAFAMLTLLIANALITIWEFAGMAAASELFGIPKYLTVPVAAVGVWLLITRGSYERVEKIFLAMSLAFLTYPIAAVLAHPNWGDVAR